MLGAMLIPAMIARKLDAGYFRSVFTLTVLALCTPVGHALQRKAAPLFSKHLAAQPR